MSNGQPGSTGLLDRQRVKGDGGKGFQSQQAAKAAGQRQNALEYNLSGWVL